MICKVYPIYSTSDIANSIDYIMDPSKVIPDANDSGTLMQQLPETMVQEVTVTEGEVSVKYVSSYLTTPEEIKDRILYLQNVYACFQGDARACGGPIAYHIIISAAPNEHISDDNMHLFAAKVLELLGYPAIWSTHIRPVFDKKWGLFRGTNKHAHAIVSAFPDDVYSMPQKLELGLHNERLRTMVDRLAIEHGYQTVVDADYERSNSYYGSMKARQGDSWMQAARDEVSAIALEAMNRTEFERLLTEHNYTIQQIGDDYLYNVSEGHQVMGHVLGREYTLEHLENSWAAEHEGAIDSELEQAEKVHGPLYVHVPLGGRFAYTKEFQRCNLEKLATTYCEWAIESYLRPGRMYEITDENGVLVRRAEGQQIVNYLGCGDAAWETNSTLSEEIRRRRLAWHLNRIEVELDRACERHTQCAALRYEYLYRWKRENLKERSWTVPDWDKWTEKSRIELLGLMLLECLIPNFDSGLWKEQRLSDDLAEEERSSREYYAWDIEREEDIHNMRDLDVALSESNLFYDRMAEELAAINLDLESLRPLLKALRQCGEARAIFDACSAKTESFTDLCRQYPQVVRAYREAVSAVG